MFTSNNASIVCIKTIHPLALQQFVIEITIKILFYMNTFELTFNDRNPRAIY